MNPLPRRRGHLNTWALAALVACDGRTKAEIAVAADMTPQAFNDLLSGRRHGRHPETRGTLAVALDVDPRALECLCDGPDLHDGGVG